mmetsp:Transcript_23824/g.19998  ORF Transcript_23824/g.19998 Transcript_23824/m.19998 type:complete len:215 (+) Transcript_23824:202-846(+)
MKASEAKTPGEIEAIESITNKNAVSECDPEVASALGNLSEEELKNAIKNTYNTANPVSTKGCELPKIYLSELAITGGLTDEQAQMVSSAMAITRYFIQNKSKVRNRDMIKNSSKFGLNLKSQIVSKFELKNDSQFIKQITDFALGENECDAIKLKSQLDIIVSTQLHDVMKKALCGAMSHEPWQKGFASANGDLAAHLEGISEKAWWSIIPPVS